MTRRWERGTAPAQTLEEIFGSESWRTEVIGADVDERLGRAIPLIAMGIGARWWTSAVRMVTGGQATRYLLLHLTNSDDGRDLMKECAWSVSPAGEFMVRRSDNPDQQFLIKPERDLKKDGIVAADPVPGRKFGAAANPLLRLDQSGGGTPRK
jgi:hypothetical protein